MLSNHIDVRHGDIFQDLRDGKVTTIIHAMNRKGSFKSGFSRQVADEFPQAVEADFDLYEQDGKREKGGVSIAVIGSIHQHPLRVINLYCIRNERNKKGTLLSPKQLETSLTLVNLILDDGAYGDVIGFPQMGAGIARGDWDSISQVISDTLTPKAALYLPSGY